VSRFGVTPAKEAELLARMAACGLVEADLEERHVRSGGPGGQHVNRSATCIYLRHKPTALEVKMQQARSQALNRFYARRRMCELLEAMQGQSDSKAIRARDKVRRKKAQRRRRAKKKYGKPAD
jgi:protein subunit release factor B